MTAYKNIVESAINKTNDNKKQKNARRNTKSAKYSKQSSLKRCGQQQKSDPVFQTYHTNDYLCK